jgi:hypothetical protein
MANPEDDVLHHENHSRLTTEEIAKAVARHNRDHSATPKDKTSAQPGEKRPAKVKKAGKP